MKKKYYILTAIFSYLALLIITIPAKPVTELISDNSPVNIQGVSGTLWNGKAYIITANNMQFKKTAWSFQPWKLFTGKLAINIDSHYLKNNISAELGSSFTGRYSSTSYLQKLPRRKLQNSPTFLWHNWMASSQSTSNTHNGNRANCHWPVAR